MTFDPRNVDIQRMSQEIGIHPSTLYKALELPNPNLQGPLAQEIAETSDLEALHGLYFQVVTGDVGLCKQVVDKLIVVLRNRLHEAEQSNDLSKIQELFELIMPNDQDSVPELLPVFQASFSRTCLSRAQEATSLEQLKELWQWTGSCNEEVELIIIRRMAEFFPKKKDQPAPTEDIPDLDDPDNDVMPAPGEIT